MTFFNQKPVVIFLKKVNFVFFHVAFSKPNELNNFDYSDILYAFFLCFFWAIVFLIHFAFLMVIRR